MLTSPLRYPGGKQLLSHYISCVLEAHMLSGCTFYEPYAGGASVSLQLLDTGSISKAILVERDILIYAFWHSVLNNADELCRRIGKMTVSLNTWKKLQPMRQIALLPKTESDILELGLAGLFFNRTNFSGIISAGPIGGMKQKSDYKIDCRFNKERTIEQIMAISSHKKMIEVHHSDAIQFLKKSSRRLNSGGGFVYIDPPYYTQGKRLYRHYYEHSDHALLADFITKQNYPWLISYDQHPSIQQLYKDNAIQAIYLDYRVKTSRQAEELLISNMEIPPPFYEKAQIKGISYNRSVGLNVELF